MGVEGAACDGVVAGGLRRLAIWCHLLTPDHDLTGPAACLVS
ncbi:hypothetical protein NOCARDAX2BIS_460031 [Nocardioides sp. AX2bis]|nr:hypothetical protein NOCARDAX2BIS_460031 [Nocardioides sp. AX2bis]